VNIYIVRHGSAVQGAVNDSKRELNARGVIQAAGAGRWIKNQLSGKARILVSPYVRAMQTGAQISSEVGVEPETCELLTPDADLNALLEYLSGSNEDLILISHLPLVGHLAAMLVDGQLYDQPWSPAEVWQLDGEVAAAGCMIVKGVWYPVLDGL